MIKQFTAGDITVRPFGTFKHWTIQSIDSASTDAHGISTYYNSRIEVNKGLELSSSFYPSSSIYYSPINEPVNSSGKYARNVYSTTDAMFYRYANEPIKLFGVEQYTADPVTGKKEVREIHGKVIAASLKHNVWGEKIVPNTVNMTDDSNIHQTLYIYDDGYTNLYVTGSHFPSVQQIGAIVDHMDNPYWDSSLGQFYVTFRNGDIQYVNLENAKQYMEMGLPVTYVPTGSGSYLAWDGSTHEDLFQPNNEHFGESVSSWGPYVAAGSSMDDYSLSSIRVGYASVFKHDPKKNVHRLVAKMNFPFTQSSAEPPTYFEDSFGYSVSIRDGFFAVGSPYGEACSSGVYNGYVCVYDKDKGGQDNWGIINMLKGKSNGDRFGNSVALDNDILAVGAPGASGSKGEVYIFRKHRYMDAKYPCQNINTGSTWHQVITTEDFCSELTTGSYITSHSYTPTFVSGNYTWTYETTVSSSISSTGDNFGWCVSVDSDHLVIGTNKTGNGYAALFTCSYSSASLNSCPTSSWREVKIFYADDSYGDLNTNSPEYFIDVSNTIPTNKFGVSVSNSGNNIVIGCQRDKAFKPYAGYIGKNELGAAYFYNYGYDADCGKYDYYLTTKTFGNREYQTNNNFAKAVSMDGLTAAVTSLSDTSSLTHTIARSVDYVSGNYVLENYNAQSTSSSDSVLGRVTIYNYNDSNNSWKISGELRRNKESGNPHNIYGYSVSVGSDFMCVGAPIVNTASLASYSQIINPANQSGSFPSSYSGSVYVYDLQKYEEGQLIGNVFYKNGYFVITNTGSNYSGVMMGTGSNGFELKYQGTHTIYEHEYLISVRPGEFNYSTNPSSLVNNPLLFDVNQDGVVDVNDVNLVMRYLRMKKFYETPIFDDNGIVPEQDSIDDYSWWANDIIQTESEDVLLQEGLDEYSGSLYPFTKEAFDYIETNLVQTGILDIDGDGNINLNDGYIFAIYCIGGLNPSRLEPYLTTASSRKYVKDIELYMNKYCGQDKSKVNPAFLGYQYSSSYDATGSFLSPCVTTIGLYQDNQLVAVGKLGRPIKNLIDWPVNIVVRFDT